MQPEKSFHRFSTLEEELNYLHKYELLSPTKNTVPRLYYVKNTNSYLCRVIGYESNYETWSNTVIDFGEGPHFVHSDYLIEMQKRERKKGESLDKLPDTYVIFDLETTSKYVRTCEVIQIGAIRIADNQITETFSSYVKPLHPIPASATKINGITDLTVCMAPDIKTVLPEFLKFIDNDCIAGYNIASFDTTILYDLVKSLYNADFTNDYFDFYHLYKRSIPKSDIDDYKQTTIAKYFNVDFSSAHDALADCKISFDCYMAFLKQQDVFSEQTTSQKSDKDTTLDTKNRINCIRTDFDRKLLETLELYIAKEKLPPQSLYLYSNGKGKETSKSICIYEPPFPIVPYETQVITKNAVCLKYLEKGNKVLLYIVPQQYEDIPYFYSENIEARLKQSSGNSFYEVAVSVNDPFLFEYIVKLVDFNVKNYTPKQSFGCCSKFKECSDALECVHENKLYAAGCKYRKINLENGRIFYGKNRNID